jgi:hypothetical protein
MPAVATDRPSSAAQTAVPRGNRARGRARQRGHRRRRLRGRARPTRRVHMSRCAWVPTTRSSTPSAGAATDTIGRPNAARKLRFQAGLPDHRSSVRCPPTLTSTPEPLGSHALHILSRRYSLHAAAGGGGRVAAGPAAQAGLRGAGLRRGRDRRRRRGAVAGHRGRRRHGGAGRDAAQPGGAGGHQAATGAGPPRPGRATRRAGGRGAAAGPRAPAGLARAATAGPVAQGVRAAGAVPGPSR